MLVAPSPYICPLAIMFPLAVISVALSWRTSVIFLLFASKFPPSSGVVSAPTDDIPPPLPAANEADVNTPPPTSRIGNEPVLLASREPVIKTFLLLAAQPWKPIKGPLELVVPIASTTRLVVNFWPLTIPLALTTPDALISP